jgi:molybdopterin synthase catalytic subunit
MSDASGKSGGDRMNDGEGVHVAIVAGPIDVEALIASVSGHDAGAVSLFLGTVRGSTGGRKVLFLEYESYMPMAERALREIASGLVGAFGPCRVAIAHRTGRLELGEVSVAIAVASPHRRVAIAACSEAIERIKTSVPIWKKEHFEGGAVWIEGDRSAPEEKTGQGPDQTEPSR